ncbi:DUF4129 domain-containing transglutaminase family protein [Paenibacillus sp. 1P07SE]|uniref:DUF4129 domain-containing transglutaminase family protein n=1 Tax=Paenibacillus sp. 1P07SE TaxID=3132209 RepID=UPI0039A40A62
MRLVRDWFHSIVDHWYPRLSFLFVAVLIWQVLGTLEGYWWEETYFIVGMTLVASVVIELLIPGRRMYRAIVQLALVIALTLQFTGFQWLGFAERPSDARQWAFWLEAHATQVHPFLWIVLGVWLFYSLAGQWATSRSHVVLVISGCMLTLLIADSFTPIVLWDKVAWTIFIGLIWLVAEHFAKFQAKHPESWGHLIEYPAALILPSLLVLSLVMASGLFVPNIAPVLKDPYTIWRESRGETVPSFVGDKGPVSTSTNAGDSRSGYSRNDEALGGGFEFDYSSVMTVYTDRKSYWRGESKAEYTGEGWVDAPGERREGSMIGIVSEEQLPIEDGPTSEVETVEVRQVVTMIREEPLPVLFGGAPISSLVAVTDDEDQSIPIPGRVAWLPGSWELHWPEQNVPVPYPSSYTLTSQMAVLDEEGLRAASTDLGNAQKNNMYLQIPDSVPQRVYDLTEEITAEAQTPYDQVKAIETYLRDNFVYTNSPDIDKRVSADFVDSFLFEVMEGYCDYYSTAMAVMTRAKGIPTRWVKGYAPGIISGIPDFDMGGPPELDLNPDGSGTYTVRNADAHSWVEVYFEGYGWIPFEPTSGFVYPYAVAQETPDVPIAEPTPTETPTVQPETVEPSRLPLFGAIMALVIGAVLLWIRRRQIAAAVIKFRFRSYTANQRIVWETEKLLRYCRRNGLEYNEHETLREAVTVWSERRNFLREDFHEVLLQFEKAKYSGIEATPDEAEQLVAKVKSIRERL